MAQRTEIDECLREIDADQDGSIGLLDYIIFAARVKEVYFANFHGSMTSISSAGGDGES